MKITAATLCLLLVLGMSGCDNAPPVEPASIPADSSVSAESTPAESEPPELTGIDSTMFVPTTPQPFTLSDLMPDPADATFLVPTTDDYVLLVHKPYDSKDLTTVLYSYDEQGNIVGQVYKTIYPDEATLLGHLPDYHEVSRLMAGEAGWTEAVHAYARVGLTIYQRLFPREIENTYTKNHVFNSVYDDRKPDWEPVDETGYTKFYFSNPVVPVNSNELKPNEDTLGIYLEPATLYDTLDDFVDLPTDVEYNFLPVGDDYLRQREIVRDGAHGKVSEELICSFDENGIVFSESKRLEFESSGAASTFLASITTGPTPGYDLVGNYIYIYKPTPPPAGFGDKYYYLKYGVETFINLGPFYMTKPYLTPEQLDVVREKGRILW